MRNLVRIIKAAAVGMAFSAVAITAGMAETWSLAHLQPADSSEGRVHQRFADLVKEYTDSEIEINVFPASQLGAAPELMQQLEAGVIQIYVEGTGTGNIYVPELQFMAAPFLFDDMDHWRRFLRSGAMKPYFDILEKEHNMTVIGEVIGDQTLMPRGPFRVLVTKEPVRTLEDIQGMKLRMFESKFHIDVWNNLGASPIVLGWADVYEALRNGIVSAVTSPISLVEGTRFYEQAPNIARTDEFMAGLAYMVNTETWRSLSDENREAIIKAYKEAAVMADELVARDLEETLAYFEANNVNFVELDSRQFAKKIRPYYQDMVANNQMPPEIWKAVEATR